MVDYIQQAPQGLKVTSDVGVWGTVAVGWLGLLQPWLTALATVLAIAWTSIQIYSYIQTTYKRRVNNK